MAKEKSKTEKEPGAGVRVGKSGKMDMKRAKKSDSDNLGKPAAKRGEGGFKNKAMQHKR